MKLVSILLLLQLFAVQSDALLVRQKQKIASPTSTIRHKIPFRAVHLYSGSDSDDVFGSEFNQIPNTISSFRSKNDLRIRAVDRNKVMKGYENLRINYFYDSLLVSILGLAVVWAVGTVKDSFSYAVGSGLGICYSLLLGRYVERLGTIRENKASDGIRFVPVVLLVALYGKFHDLFSIIPEIIGFVVSYQLSGLLQVFNDDLYNEKSQEKE